MQERRGICWPHAGTVGNIAVTQAGTRLRGEFDRALFDCDFLPAAKYRNGAARWWCRTHQGYWGVKADLEALEAHGAKRCRLASAPLAFVLDPLVLDLRWYTSVRIDASGAGMHVRAQPATAPIGIDAFFRAIALTGIDGVFACAGIDQVNVTPPGLRALDRHFAARLRFD